MLFAKDKLRKHRHSGGCQNPWLRYSASFEIDTGIRQYDELDLAHFFT